MGECERGLYSKNGCLSTETVGAMCVDAQGLEQGASKIRASILIIWERAYGMSSSHYFERNTH